jgi:hypothetical protein
MPAPAQGTSLATRLADVQFGAVLLARLGFFATMGVLFLSLRLVLAGILPSLFPLLVYFAALAWIDVPLGIPTVVVAIAWLGVGIDAAVGLLLRFDDRFRDHGDRERAIREAIATAGPAILCTGLAVAPLFLIALLAVPAPLRPLVLATAMLGFAAIVANLVLLPALLVSVAFVDACDLITARLGHTWQEAIPVLRGLTSAQARTAVGLGEWRAFAEGETIVEPGVTPCEFHILITGRVEVRLKNPRGGTARATLEQGDVVGEIGALQNAPRKAQVVALEPSELLVVRERFFTTLARRNPRVASLIGENLTRILSKRLGTGAAPATSS